MKERLKDDGRTQKVERTQNERSQRRVDGDNEIRKDKKESG